jgi:hypothetical protein
MLRSTTDPRQVPDWAQIPRRQTVTAAMNPVAKPVRMAKARRAWRMVNPLGLELEPPWAGAGMPDGARAIDNFGHPQATGVSRVWLALSNMPRVGASLRHCKGGLHERLQLPATRTSGANHRHSPNVHALSRILDHPPGSDMRLPDLGMRVSLDSGTMTGRIDGEPRCPQPDPHMGSQLAHDVDA